MSTRNGGSPDATNVEATNTETDTHQGSGSAVDGTPSGYPDLGSHAIAYARAGLDVLPLVPGGKVPHRLAPHGKDSATSDVAQVRDWWVQAPDANIGLRPAEGIVVVDVDPRDDGDLNLAALIRKSKLGTAGEGTPRSGVGFEGDGVGRVGWVRRRVRW